MMVIKYAIIIMEGDKRIGDARIVYVLGFIHVGLHFIGIIYMR
jgi:hypothetical protein